MKQLTVVFFGRAGSGKGTQAALLMKALAKQDPARTSIYVETGEKLRSFMRGGSYSASIVKKTLEEGKLLGPYLPIWIWMSCLIEQYTGHEHLVFDGVARRVDEAPVLDSAMQVYGGGGRPKVIVLEVPPHEVKTRLLKRGRHDDVEEKIAERLRAYETDIVRSIEYFEKSPTVDFIRIDGHQTIEEVHADVMEALGLAGV